VEWRKHEGRACGMIVLPFHAQSLIGKIGYPVSPMPAKTVCAGLTVAMICLTNWGLLEYSRQASTRS
jgi:hypothetical protein